jgi:outer membrane cobalamin receptor
VRAQASAWCGNTDDLIVWMPDYRFIWSPRNTDVRRRGADASASIGLGALTLDAGWSYAKVAYRNLEDDVQVLYRPRHTGSIALQAAAPRWQARVESRYIGARNTAPTRLNSLPGFWTVNVSGSARTAVSGFLLETRLSVDRLNNEQESLIFGFPQPTRVLRVELRIADKVNR